MCTWYMTASLYQSGSSCFSPARDSSTGDDLRRRVEAALRVRTSLPLSVERASAMKGMSGSDKMASRTVAGRRHAPHEEGQHARIEPHGLVLAMRYPAIPGDH